MPASFGGDGSIARYYALVALLLAPTICGGGSGCVRRRMTILSDPPGARVYLDDYEIGTTPISHNLIYYGDRKIRLVKDGYETLTVMQPVPRPWYQIPPLDFVTENLIPGELRDQRTFRYQLISQRVVPSQELLRRGENLRRGVVPVRSSQSSPMTPGTPGQTSPWTSGATPGAPRPEWIPAPEGIGGQGIHPLPPGRQ